MSEPTFPIVFHVENLSFVLWAFTTGAYSPIIRPKGPKDDLRRNLCTDHTGKDPHRGSVGPKAEECRFG